ncbi:RNA polymerase sigma factor for flagellar operon [Cellvibrio zantedeschiae]|uniref:RNA polymerase sigma factor for flagellar operon n=1 Tax=Cellvibrio zantedeschiae TaxID=1237077 RepID=A0ABQ3B9B3_9GAMM|nr:sigma-70 family RNA polymerase sigma factor [Cellvibrio zantedeschiae]GGY84858.1 RNA polymerase sigma factor for flagellar operon [Cellvibrio zantedeschiae]
MQLDNCISNRSNDSISELWMLYLETTSIEARNSLFLYYLPWMKKISTSMYSKYSSRTTEWRDCVQIGSVALLEAISRYDPSVGVPFEGFAYSRLKGAILNIAYRESTFTKNTQNESDMNFEPFESLEDESAPHFDTFLDSVINAAFSILLDSSAAQAPVFSSNPMDIYSSHSQEEKLMDAISKLDKASKFIIEAHYMSYLKFKDIATSLNVSTSRVSQLHTEALKKLRIIYEKY